MPLMFRIEASKSVLKDVDKLPPKVRIKVREVIWKLKINPVPPDEDVKKLKGLENTYRLRLGRYRILYRVLWKERKVVILYIGERGRAYKKI